MKKFEYKFVVVEELMGEEEIMRMLNLEGSEGWEAIHFYKICPTLGFVAVGEAQQKIIFKREISEN